MPNETTAVKNPIKKLLKAQGIEHITITTGGFGSSGWPDICFLYKGIFVGIEAKFGDNKPTELQKKRLRYIRDQGGIPMLVYETNVSDVEKVLEAIEWAHDQWLEDGCDRLGQTMANIDLKKVKLWRDGE